MSREGSLPTNENCCGATMRHTDLTLNGRPRLPLRGPGLGLILPHPLRRKLGSSSFVVVNACFPSGALQAENVRRFTGLRIVTAGGLELPRTKTRRMGPHKPTAPPAT